MVERKSVRHSAARAGASRVLVRAYTPGRGTPRRRCARWSPLLGREGARNAPSGGSGETSAATPAPHESILAG